MKHRYMKGNIPIYYMYACIYIHIYIHCIYRHIHWGKGNISVSKHVYEGVKCHVSHTVSENMRTLSVDQSNTTASIATSLQKHRVITKYC